MSISNLNSAEVVTLTAEVRVLMVGNRQITLSVAKQLDEVYVTEIEPFGRVRISNKVMIIGKNKEDGSLVKASFPSSNEYECYCTYDGKIKICGNWYKYSTYDYKDKVSYVKLKYDTETIIVDYSKTCSETNNSECNSDIFFTENGYIVKNEELHECIHDEVDRLKNLRRLVSSLKMMPLIVLAGLK